MDSRVPVNTILLENNSPSGSGSPRGVKSLALNDLDDPDDEGVALENGLYPSRWQYPRRYPWVASKSECVVPNRSGSASHSSPAA